VSAPLLLDTAIALALLGLAAWTIVTRDTFGAIIGFVTFGLLSMLAWLRLGAPDVAITEGAIGSGLSGLVLLSAAAKLRTIERTEPDRPVHRALIATIAVFCGGLSAGLGAVVFLLPDAPSSLAASAMANLPATQLGNPVTGVLLAYRALDTLLEKVVLVLAIAGVWCLIPDRCWGGRPAFEAAPPSGPLILLARVLPPIGILFGIYLFWNGADRPGGAFPGGAVLAAMALLVLAAKLLRAPPVTSRWLRGALLAGPIAFVLVGVAGYPMAGDFLAFPASHAKLLIVFVETFIMVSIPTTLVLLVLAPPKDAPR
jgi:multisubunit Na+/H+ antiporter MnhB subunit